MDDLRKINFIYGANGSGKTTISKLLNNSGGSDKVTINWKNNIQSKILVYNKDFRKANFRKGNIDGVFTLGQATQDEIDIINIHKANLKELKDKGIKRKETLLSQEKIKSDKEDQFKEQIWREIYKKHETVFKEAFIGFQKKETFKDRLLKESITIIKSKTYDELLEKSKVVFGKVPTHITPIVTIEYSRLVEIEENKIWTKKILGKADIGISAIIQRLNLNDWVNEGRNYILDSNTCPFCQQETITDAFKTQLESYFDESFTNDINLVETAKEEYIRIFDNIIGILNQIEVTQKIEKENKLNIDIFSAYLKTLISQQTSNKELLENKIKEPSRSISLISIKEQLDSINNLIVLANLEIKKHNDIVANFQTEKSQLIQAVWKFLYEDNKSKIGSFIKEVEGIQKGISNLSNEIETLRGQYSVLDNTIKELSRNVTSTQPSIDEINDILVLYGFNNFKIVPSSEVNQYQIQRENGDLVESTLSEGEVTFITFLYFLQLAKGGTSEDNVNDERILVIDDPISSLDSNVLFVVSSLIKEIIKAIKNNDDIIKQLIILTHNVYFHKEVSYVDGSRQKDHKTQYWILRKNKNVSTIESYGTNNPIQNSYELLWSELQNPKNISAITIQNIMRRILENYFKILGKYKDDDLILKFGNKQEQEICRSLLCWINDGSHCIPDDLFVELPDSVIDKYSDVFRNVFINMGHIEHYNMMMGISNDDTIETL